MKFKNIIPLLLIAALFAVSCVSENEETLFPKPPPLPVAACDTMNVSYKNDVKPMMDVADCTACHSQASQAGGIGLFDHGSISSTDTTKLLGSIQHLAGFVAMPFNEPNKDLTAKEIQLIQCWFRNGAPDN